MRGYVDLHCHWVFGIDDGARTSADSLGMLTGLHSIGFDTVIATPHMRPGMFDNTKAKIQQAFNATIVEFAHTERKLPEIGLSSEHFFDHLVFERFLNGHALPYPGGHAALVEFPTQAFPTRVGDRFFDLRQRRIRPVLAHPERYEPVWRDIHVLEPLLDGGTLLLLDVAALTGKYGRKARSTAETLLEEGFYYAACSDAHAPKDIDDVAKGIELLIGAMGDEEAMFLLSTGPRGILNGQFEQ